MKTPKSTTTTQQSVKTEKNDYLKYTYINACSLQIREMTSCLAVNDGNMNRCDKQLEQYMRCIARDERKVNSFMGN